MNKMMIAFEFTCATARLQNEGPANLTITRRDDRAMQFHIRIMYQVLACQ
jgi:hypothetical protein